MLDTIPDRLRADQVRALYDVLETTRTLRRVLRRLGPRPKQVLVVDPNYDSRTIIRTALEGGRYEVVETERGAAPRSPGAAHLVTPRLTALPLQSNT